MIFQGFRRFLEAIKALTSSLERLAQLQEDLGPALDRIGALESARYQFEAECEGRLLKADGKLKAASNAEARERQLKKAAERLADPFPEEGEGEPHGTLVLSDHAAASEAERLQTMRVALAPNSKTAAVRYKFGL